MRRIAFLALAGAIALSCASCGNSSPVPAKTEAAAPAAPAVPPDIQAAANAALGSETEVLAHGDLARTGHQQVLAINRLKGNPEKALAGTLVTRVAVIESEGGTWKEVFRCDEHLKNAKGYLGGTPLAGVGGWRLQYEEDATKGLQMYFTPIAKPEGGYIQTIGVRWNPALKRYQSLSRDYEQFLGETPALETPQSQVRR